MLITSLEWAIAVAGHRELQRAQKKLAETVNDAALGEVVGRHLHLHAITIGETNEALAHFSGDVCEHGMLVGELDVEHRSREYVRDLAFDFDCLFLRHV